MGDVKKRTVRKPLCKGYGPPLEAVEPTVEPVAERAEREASPAQEAGDA